MDIEQFKKIIMLCEARDTNNPNIEYIDEPNGKKVIAKLYSYKSQTYTKLAQKLQRMEELTEEMKQLKDQIKTHTKEDVADLFDADDAVRTRVVETISFIFTLTKDPKETVSPKYKEILTELEQHLTPELIEILEKIRNQEKMVTKTQKSPGLSVNPVTESKLDDKIRNIFRQVKNTIMDWARSYDKKLDMLKRKAEN